MSHNRIANRKVQRAAQKLVEYLEHDEFKDYLGELPRDHIWLSVRIVRDWLDIPPSEHEREDIKNARAELAEREATAA